MNAATLATLFDGNLELWEVLVFGLAAAFALLFVLPAIAQRRRDGSGYVLVNQDKLDLAAGQTAAQKIANDPAFGLLPESIQEMTREVARNNSEGAIFQVARAMERLSNDGVENIIHDIAFSYLLVRASSSATAGQLADELHDLPNIEAHMIEKAPRGSIKTNHVRYDEEGHKLTRETEAERRSRSVIGMVHP